MADRDLSVKDLQELLSAHGCRVGMSAANTFKAVLGTGLGAKTWSQHAHRSDHDTFDRHIVRAARRRLGLHEMSDEDFYAPLD